jgi:phosphoglucosamine mutase
MGRPLSELRTLRPRRPQTLVNVRMAARKPLDDWPAFQEAWRAQEEALAGAGRFVIRYSGTEPLLRIMAEGRDEAQVQAAVEALAAVARADA